MMTMVSSKSGPAATATFPSLSFSTSSMGTGGVANISEAEQAGQARTREAAHAFGTIIGALMRSPRHRKLKLQDLESAVIPALLLGQFVIAHAPVPDRPGESVPVAALWWAMVSPDIDQRLARATTFPLTLHREEWRSGDIPWIIDAAGHPASLRALVDEVSRKVMNGVQPRLPPAAFA